MAKPVGSEGISTSLEEESAQKSKHHQLAGVVKGVHAELRRKFHQSGGDYEQVWMDHCEDTSTLSEYADAMHHLATDIWTKNPETRIEWCRKICLEYFHGDGLKKVFHKEERRRRHHEKQRLAASKSGSFSGDTDSSVGVQSQCSDLTASQSADSIDSEETGTSSASEQSAQNPDFSASGEPGGIIGSKNALGKVNFMVGSPLLNVETPNVNNPMVILPPQDTNLQRVVEANSSQQSGTSSIDGSQTDSRLVHCLDVPASGDGCSGASSAGSPGVGGDVLIFGTPEDLKDAGMSLYKKYKTRHYNTVSVPFEGKIRLLDVGSCYNPFLDHDAFLSVGIDICPAVESVYECDFLHLEVTEPLQLAADTTTSYLSGLLHSPITRLPGDSFHVIVFSLLLEYFPSCYQRWLCCEKAHSLLALNGLLVIITPDSKHQNRNAPMIKSWKRGIESLGFQRWKYIKLEHLHCMAFRKVPRPEKQNNLVSDIGPDLLYIPQDFHDQEEKENDASTLYLFGSAPCSEPDDSFLREQFMELPDVESV